MCQFPYINKEDELLEKKEEGVANNDSDTKSNYLIFLILFNAIKSSIIINFLSSFSCEFILESHRVMRSV